MYLLGATPCRVFLSLSLIRQTGAILYQKDGLGMETCRALFIQRSLPWVAQYTIYTHSSYTETRTLQEPISYPPICHSHSMALCSSLPCQGIITVCVNGV